MSAEKPVTPPGRRRTTGATGLAPGAAKSETSTRPRRRGAPEPTSRRPEDTPVDALVQEFVARTELTGVRTTHLSGDLLFDDVTEIDSAELLRLRLDTSSRILSPTQFQCHYRFGGILVDEQETEVATIEIGIVATFKMRDELGIDKSSLTGFIKQVGLIIVFPFAREALQMLTVRLGLSPVTLGLLQPDKDLPSSVSFGSTMFHGRTVT